MPKLRLLYHACQNADDHSGVLRKDQSLRLVIHVLELCRHFGGTVIRSELMSTGEDTYAACSLKKFADTLKKGISRASCCIRFSINYGQ